MAKENRYYPLASETISKGANRETPEPKAVRSPARAPVTAFDRYLVRLIATTVGRPNVILSLWNGENPYVPENASEAGRVVFLDRRTLIDVCLNPELGFGDGYSAGRIRIEGDLIDVLHRAFIGMDVSPLAGIKRGFLARLPRPGRGTLADSKKNIHFHYDLGNEFYRLWLDREMVYTCAYYPTADASLEAAQQAKMDLVCRKVGLRPGMNVVEAGCGWGSLALHMARRFGVNVRAFNISREQIRFARERAASEGLDGRVEFVEDDYRNISGSYDAFVSVGMLEHVGPENYRNLGAVIDRCLKENGRGLIHSIGRNRPLPMNSWTAHRIFPGSHAPGISEIMDIFEPYRLSVLDIENLRLHYARTLKEWLRRFEIHAEHIREMYDDTFMRAWRLYLGSSAAAFLAGNLQLFQIVFARATDNDLPLTREHLYLDGEPEHWNSG
jgi:cyclopropane-fatty-acyl-phospholipid synthase